ncbi:MAG: hypothetical protein PHP17_05390 [Candidatus Omnitrophica bacterium]|nr:hypothetical protein [Candidatus Omnitrophota bacterium]
MKRASTLIEYSVLIFIVIAAIMGLNAVLKRNFQAFIKSEADEHVRQPMPFIWQETVKFTSQSSTQDRYEEVGGDTTIISNLNAPYTTLTAPPPPVSIGAASLHVQDAASAPPSQDNPEHQAEEDNRRIQPKT